MDGLLQLSGKEMSEGIKLLIYERERWLRKAMIMSLKRLDIDVIEVEDDNHARKAIENQKPNIFVLDLRYPVGEESDLIEVFRHESGEENHVIVTTTDRPEDHWRKKYKPDTILYKPFDVRYLVKKVQECL